MVRNSQKLMRIMIDIAIYWITVIINISSQDMESTKVTISI
jgi:hypothetical protein